MSTLTPQPTQQSRETGRLPVLFIGHGTPINAIETNDFTRALSTLGKALPRPSAILCISAHWLTQGTYVEVSPQPRIIYDIYGFPQQLYQVQYPAAGAPQLAGELPGLVEGAHIEPTTDWGLDHGAWSILKHLYPQADVPVFQMSIDYHRPLAYHYKLANELRALRKRGVLIIGSGNLTHNLQQVDLTRPDAHPVDWALEFDATIKQFIDRADHRAVMALDKLGSMARLAVPEPSHYIPLIYTLGLQDKHDNVQYFYEGFQYGSLSMRCLLIGDEQLLNNT
ncbi:MAG TPA: 4,5-DOPA dioxygenase extradiol [Flammeovirgaceae bacterium]|nr:4,5-DOPA dioxygenase extradiol [Flammeovirgaceae bacterium]